MALDSIVEAIDAVRSGGMIVLVDDAHRDNEGHLVMAAELVTPGSIAFMAANGRGLVGLALEAHKGLELKLPGISHHHPPASGTDFSVSVRARNGVTTGMSTHDLAHTIQTLVAPDAGPRDWTSPGLVFPLSAHPGGVMVRRGFTEASVELVRLADLQPCAVICGIMKDDGTQAGIDDLKAFARRHRLGVHSIAQLVAHMRERYAMVVRDQEAQFIEQP